MKLGCGVLLLATAASFSGCAGGTPDKIEDPYKDTNKSMFGFNDGLYYKVLEPVSSGYAFVMPEYLCYRIDNFLQNLDMPGRAINCLLQGQFKGAGVEVSRFVINLTVGFLGLWDPAGSWGLDPYPEDFGQTFAVYSMSPGPYLCVPVLGPSSGRDLFGKVLDAIFSPLTYLVGASVVSRINYTSLHLGEYEAFQEDALDTYIALRSAWYQNRLYLIKNGGEEGGTKPPLQR